MVDISELDDDDDNALLLLIVLLVMVLWAFFRKPQYSPLKLKFAEPEMWGGSGIGPLVLRPSDAVCFLNQYFLPLVNGAVARADDDDDDSDLLLLPLPSTMPSLLLPPCNRS